MQHGRDPLGAVARGDWQRLVDVVCATLYTLHTTDFAAHSGINEAALKAIVVAHLRTLQSALAAIAQHCVDIESEPLAYDRRAAACAFPDMCISLYADRRRDTPPLFRAIIEFKYVRLAYVHMPDGAPVASAGHSSRADLLAAVQRMRDLDTDTETALLYRPYAAAPAERHRQQDTTTTTTTTTTTATTTTTTTTTPHLAADNLRTISSLCHDATLQAHRYAALLHERDIRQLSRCRSGGTATAACAAGTRAGGGGGLGIARGNLPVTTIGYIVAYGPLVRSATHVFEPDTAPL